MTDSTLPNMPAQSPGPMQSAYAYIAGVAVLLAALAFGLSQIPAVSTSASAACRASHLCSPLPPDDIQPFHSGWLGSGSTFESAVASTLSAYRTKYPDWDIGFVPGQENTRKNWGQPGYQYNGTFAYKPKWRGIFG